jgi:hypothetical protein
MFDNLHFIASLYNLSGFTDEVDSYIAKVAEGCWQRVEKLVRSRHPGVSVSKEFIVLSLTCIAMLQFRVDSAYMKRLQKQIAT